MKTDLYTKTILTVIAAMLAFNLVLNFTVTNVHAQTQAKTGGYDVVRLTDSSKGAHYPRLVGHIVGTCETTNCVLITQGDEISK